MYSNINLDYSDHIHHTHSMWLPGNLVSHYFCMTFLRLLKPFRLRRLLYSDMGSLTMQTHWMFANVNVWYNTSTVPIIQYPHHHSNNPPLFTVKLFSSLVVFNIIPSIVPQDIFSHFGAAIDKRRYVIRVDFSFFGYIILIMHHMDFDSKNTNFEDILYNLIIMVQ